MKQILYSIIFLFCIALSVSCKKYLDAKPDQSLVVPKSLTDVQSLLDNNDLMNQNGASLGEVSADNYYLTDTDLSSFLPYNKQAYLWDNEPYYGFPNDWSDTYNPVYFSNLALESLNNISRTTQNQTLWDNVKGEALFFRAKSFLEAVWLWSKAFDKTTAASDLGIPLRLKSDINAPSTRATNQETYQRIIDDLSESLQLLPTSSVHPMRPSKIAAYGLLARAYLSMRDYDNCFKYADLFLQGKSQLIDYNSVSASSHPFVSFSQEDILHSATAYFLYANLFPPSCKIDPTLYNSYDNNDLRKSLYFDSNGDGSYSFIGSYDDNLLFNGIATDEVYLMRAECYARKGDKNNALNDLNTLMQKRWKTGFWSPITATDANDALTKILIERRKELVMRCVRWIDIKRLNKEGANIVLKRVVAGQTFTLSPNENRYALPLPLDIVSISGMAQNPR